MKSTQATISRDIKELHLVKELTGSSSYKYAVSQKNTSLNATGRLNNVFRESVTSHDFAQNIVVLKTMPGMAMAAGAVLDEMNWPEIVGCIAGDDTILCAIRSRDLTLKVMDKLKTLLETF